MSIISSSWWENAFRWIGETLRQWINTVQDLPSASLQFQDDMTTKADRIEACLAQNPINLWELRELALSKGGLLSPHFRQKVWPLLVGLDGNYRNDNRSTSNSTVKGERPPTSSSISTQALVDSTNTTNSTSRSNAANLTTATEEKKMETSQEASMDLIRRDVGRSVVFRYNTQQSDTMDHRRATPTYASDRLAQALEDTIRLAPSPSGTTTIIRTSTSSFPSPRSTTELPSFTSSSNYQQQQQAQKQQQQYHYYQGLHDVAGVILHQLDYQADLGASILQRLAQSHWRDALREHFGNLTWILQHCFFPLVKEVSPLVHYQLEVAQMELSSLILSWMITWFTHDIFDADIAGRLVDAFIVSHPLLPFYLGVALLTHPKLKQDMEQADPNDPASLFVLMKQLPKFITLDQTTIIETSSEYDRRIPVQELLDDALYILHKIPPRSLLDLVDTTMAPRSAILQRATTISMFQAVRSWNLHSTTFGCGISSLSSSAILAPLGQSTSSSLSSSSSLSCHVRAKIASGIPLLMQTVGPTWMAHRQKIRRGRRRQKEMEEDMAGGITMSRRRKTTTKWQKLQRMILGKWKA